MEFRGSETHTKFKDIFKTSKEAETSALRFKSEQAMLCSQGAELAIDCNLCRGAPAPQKFKGSLLLLNFYDYLHHFRDVNNLHFRLYNRDLKISTNADNSEKSRVFKRKCNGN